METTRARAGGPVGRAHDPVRGGEMQADSGWGRASCSWKGRPASSPRTAVEGTSGGRPDGPPVLAPAVQTLLNRTFDGFDGLEGFLIPPGVGQTAAQCPKLRIQVCSIEGLGASTRIGPNGMRGRLCGSVRHEPSLSADRPGFRSRNLSRFVSVCDTQWGRKGCRRCEGGTNVYASVGNQAGWPV